VEKGNRAASRYRWLARVCDVQAVKDQIAFLKADANRLLGWKWPDDPSWDGKICTNDSTNSRAAAWLQLKLNKAVSWEDGLEIFKGYKKAQKAYNLKAAYETEGYSASDGSVLNLTDKAALLAHRGQNLVKEQVLKTMA